MVEPPPEYFIDVSGGRSKKTGHVFDGGWPANICLTFGSCASGRYPLNPYPSPRPATWPASIRGVIGLWSSAYADETFQLLRNRLISASRSSIPRSAAFNRTMPDTALLIEAA